MQQTTTVSDPLSRQITLFNECTSHYQCHCRHLFHCQCTLIDESLCYSSNYDEQSDIQHSSSVELVSAIRSDQQSLHLEHKQHCWHIYLDRHYFRCALDFV